MFLLLFKKAEFWFLLQVSPNFSLKQKPLVLSSSRPIRINVQKSNQCYKTSHFFNLLFSSHLVSIPANTSLSDALRKSPIIDDGATGGGAGFGGGFEIDEAADPELAMALRISLEEQRARQQQVRTISIRKSVLQRVGLFLHTEIPNLTCIKI